eukprot:11972551-Karenia_brevis.AAC.1
MSEYSRPDGTVGKLQYDDNISLEGDQADYRIRDPTWAENNTRRTVKGYVISPDQDGFCPFTKYETIILGKGRDFYDA